MISLTLDQQDRLLKKTNRLSDKLWGTSTWREMDWDRIDDIIYKSIIDQEISEEDADWIGEMLTANEIQQSPRLVSWDENGW